MTRKSTTIRTLLASVSGVALAVVAKAHEYFTGDGTAYTLGQSSAGNCNMMSALDFAGTDYAALNNEQWDGLQNCGRCAEVSCADHRCLDQSKSIVVQILDRCPECKHGDLDLSPTVFTALTGTTPSRYKVKWKFVDCPVSGNVNYCLKGGSNTFWTAVQPTNVATGVTSLKINGHDTVMLDSAYYYVLDGASEAQTQLTDMAISLTDINGNSIEDIVTLTADACTEGAAQFPFGSPQGSPGPAIVPIISPLLPSIELTTAPYVQVPVISLTTAPTPTPMPLMPTLPATTTTTPDNATQEQQAVKPTGSTPVSEVTAPHPPVLPVPAYAPPATPSYATASPPAPPSVASLLTTPLETAVHPIASALRTEPEPSTASTNGNAIKPTQQLTIAASVAGTPSAAKRPMSGTRDSIFRIATDRNGAQQRSRLPSRRPRSPLTIAQRTGEGRAADTSDATHAVTTQSTTPSNGTDPVIIILSALGAVALVALIATVTVAKKKKVAEQKARDVEAPSMISAQSYDAQNSPTDARHVFVAHSNGRS